MKFGIITVNFITFAHINLIKSLLVMYQKQVGFGEAISMAFSKYCCFSGRASRSEYWFFSLFVFIVLNLKHYFF